MYTFKQKLDLIKANFGSYKLSGAEKNASVMCPFCQDKGKMTNKKKLSICLDTGVYHCWVCESKGRNIGKAALKYSDYKDKALELTSVFGGLKKEEIEEIEKNEVKLPEDFCLIADMSNKKRKRHRRHIKYLYNRGFTDEDILRFRIGASSEYQFASSVIFPSNDAEGKINYFISRSIDSNAYRKYKNCMLSRKEVIFKEFDIEFDKELVLTEGVFDLLHCPENSTCILGSWLDQNYYLFRQIVKNKTPIVLCLDPDAKDKSIKIAKLLSSYCVPIRLSQHSGKDFGDMEKEKVTHYINTAKHFEFADSVGYLINNITSGSMY